ETDAWLAAGYLGLAGGLRQSLLLLLFPLWLGATLAGVRRLRTVAIGLGILSAAVLAWFLPMIWLTGGLARYLEASRLLAATAVIVIVLANGAFFVSARPARRDFDAQKSGWRRTAEHEAFDWIFSRTAAALREHEAVMETFVGAIRGLYGPDDTVVVTELGNPRS